MRVPEIPAAGEQRRTVQNSQGMHLLVDGLEPTCVGHVNLQDHVKVSLMIWSFILRHALSAKYDAVSRLDNLARRAGDMNTPSV